MKSAITNIGRNFVAQNIDAGAWFSITHFSLAWVTDNERTVNSPRPEMTQFVTQNEDGSANGDIIYNIWQSSFRENLTNKLYGFIGKGLSEGFGSQFRYEYDDCENRNVLIVNTTEYIDNEYYESGAGTDANKTTFVGARNKVDGEYDLSELSVENTPAPIKAYQILQSTGATMADKLFPIKSFRVVSTTEDVINAKNTVIDYTLELPSNNTLNPIDNIEKSIGNFKFNRIGLYVTQSVSSRAYNTISLIPDVSEPVLFAVIDLTTDSSCTTNPVLDIYKTRDDKGLTAWQADVQLNISSVLDCAGLLDGTPYYRDAIRDDATRWYQSQLEGQVIAQKAIIDLQAQVIQLTNLIKSSSGLNELIQKKGFNKIEKLNINSEYSLGLISDKVINYFDAVDFRSKDSLVINESNAIIDLFNNTFEGNVLSDGDNIKIIISNLDGRYLNIENNIIPLWGGKILIVNKSKFGDECVFEINQSHIKGFSVAKICLDFTYNSNNNKWILTSFSTVDEASSIQ